METLDPVSKDDFIQWKNSGITKRLFLSLRIRIRELEEELGVTAGRDSLADAKKVGAIQQARDTLDFTLEEYE